MLLVPILALTLAQPPGPQVVEDQTYAACVSTPEPVVCVTELAISRTEEGQLDFTDLIAAGAVSAARRHAPAEIRETAEIAARIADGQGYEGLSPREAQQVLELFSDVSFHDSGLPGDARAIGLWPIAMREPVGDFRLRSNLIHAASRSNRDDLETQLVLELPVDGPWSDEERASLASMAARIAGDWRRAEAFLASGGDRAEGYSIPGIRIAIDEARLRQGYDRDAAGRVMEKILSAWTQLPWPSESLEALKAGGATGELLALGTALVARGRAAERSPEDRTDDFGQAAWAFRAAGDRGAALAAAREGMDFVPGAVASRGELSSFGTWPVRELFELAPDEAVASGFLWGYYRYMSTAKAGGVADPDWLTEPRIDYQLKLVVPSLQRRRAVWDAKALLLRLQAAPADWASADAEELMMLAAIAGEGQLVEGIFNDAVRSLDALKYHEAWAALQLVIARRAADVELQSGRADRQSP